MNNIPESDATADWQFACPKCRAPLALRQDRLSCIACGETYSRIDGIWRLLARDRRGAYDQFLAEYGTVRRWEGWGRGDADYFRNLPSVPRSDPQWPIWKLRQRTYRALIERVVRTQEEDPSHPAKVLDLGAGNCWLSHRLAQYGHLVAAIDVSLDALDGLGANRYYPATGPPIVLVQAEFDLLPFRDGEIDLVIFNGSFHYSPDYRSTLRECLRVMQATGRLVIMDSPVYEDASSGSRMVAEREERYLEQHGFRSQAIGSKGFLTWAGVAELGADMDLVWQFVIPRLGPRYLLKRTRALLRSDREPARMPILVAQRSLESTRA